MFAVPRSAFWLYLIPGLRVETRLSFIFNKCTAPRAFLHLDSFKNLLQVVAGAGGASLSSLFSLPIILKSVPSMGRTDELDIQAGSGESSCHLALPSV
jgi:hypothetical protein